MPVLSRFHGIVITMCFFAKEHNPPHIHAIYGEDAAAIDIQTGEIIDGQLPPKALQLIAEWLLLHKTELLKIWKTQEFTPIPPLE